MFNPNELILERIVTVEGFDPADGSIALRNTQIESPNLTTSATSTAVVDALGTTITEFYQAQTGTFSYTNSLLSLDLAAKQFGSPKQLGGTGNEIISPASELLTIGTDATVVLKHAPFGEENKEIGTVTVVDADGAFGKTYTQITGTVTEDTFTLDVDTKTITFNTGTVGKVLVAYNYKAADAVKLTKTTDSVPETLKLHIKALFHPPCNPNLLYTGWIICPRAQIDISDVSLALTSDGKHPVSYKLQKDYCADKATLFDIIVVKD